MQLVGAARTLAALETNRRDITGFTNTDREFGRRLANIVEAAGGSDPDAIRVLAWLIARRYSRQTSAMFTAEQLAEIEAIAPQTVTKDERDRLRHVVTVFPRGEDHVLVGWQENTKFPDSVTIGREVRAFPVKRVSSERGAMYELSVGAAQPLLNRIRAKGFRVVVSSELEASLERRVDRRIGSSENEIHATRVGDLIALGPLPANPTYRGLVRGLPGRKFDPETQRWLIAPQYVGDICAQLEAAGADVSELRNLDLPQVDAGPPKISVVRSGSRFTIVFPYERELSEKLRRVQGAYYSTALHAWRLPKAALQSFASILDTHPRKYDRADLDAALKMLPTPAPDLDIRIPKRIERVETPGEFAKPYQLEAIEALCQPFAPLRKALGDSLRGFLLADERGLGKTMEVAIPADKLTPAGSQILVVATKSFRRGWRREIRSWIDADAEVALYTGSGELPKCRWLIVTYEQLAHVHAQLVGGSHRIHTLIIDEAHRIKNPHALRSRYIAGRDDERDPEKSMPGIVDFVDGRIFVVTGTPIPNRARDAFNYLRVIGHPLGENFFRFAQRYCDPVQDAKYGTRYDGASHIDELRERLRPVMIARRKEDVLPQLPPKIRQFLPVDIDRRSYMRTVEAFEPQGDSMWRDPSRTLAFFNAARMATAFAKIPATIELVEDAIRDEEKVIVFSGSTQVLDQIAAHFGPVSVQIDGRKSERQREAAEIAFNTNPAVKLLLGQWLAAGESLNLTAATQVIFNEIDWVPKTHVQSEDRAHRMTTKHAVNITYVLADRTLDVHIARILKKKMELINTFEGAQESFFDELAAAVKGTYRANKAVVGAASGA